MSSILLINPVKKRGSNIKKRRVVKTMARRKKRKAYGRRRRRSYRRNPVGPLEMAVAANPVRRRRINPGIGMSLATDLLVASGGFTAGIFIPTALRAHGPTRYLAQAGLFVMFLMGGRMMRMSRVANRAAIGAGIALFTTLINDLIMKPQGRAFIMSQDEEEIRVPALTQDSIPTLEQGGTQGTFYANDNEGTESVLEREGEPEMFQDEDDNEEIY
jgi:hypothetical protein